VTAPIPEAASFQVVASQVRGSNLDGDGTNLEAASSQSHVAASQVRAATLMQDPRSGVTGAPRELLRSASLLVIYSPVPCEDADPQQR
jgi:hypothetical protein